MHKGLLLALVAFICPPKLRSQIFPKEGSSLNYRIIGFSFPTEGKKGAYYRIEIAKGDFNTVDGFKKNIIKSIKTSQEQIIVEVPSWGTSYTWRVVTSKNSKMPELHHFTTGSVPVVDTSLTRFRMLKKAKNIADAYVFLDGTRALYDLEGNPVWYLPRPESNCLDLKVSPQGTITMLLNLRPLEVNYNGDTMWTLPVVHNGKSDSTHDLFHHCFTRLSNGNYMAMGGDASPANDTPGNEKSKIKFGTILEFDQRGKVVWEWSSGSYYKHTALYKNATREFDVHENSFYFDEQSSAIYVSYKLTNTILKVKYPEGHVLGVYGANDSQSVQEAGENLFCGQHSCRSATPGYFYLFNNNSCNPGALPHVVLMKELPGRNAVNKIWDYECTVDEAYVSNTVRGFAKGGNVIQLPDSSMFVSMCSPYSKVFIVGPDKEILWSAIPEQRQRVDSKWEKIGLYRASIISRKELEQLVLTGAKRELMKATKM